MLQVLRFLLSNLRYWVDEYNFGEASQRATQRATHICTPTSPHSRLRPQPTRERLTGRSLFTPTDGFRFDGVTSMMYTHHGLSVAFTGNYKARGRTDADAHACHVFWRVFPRPTTHSD